MPKHTDPESNSAGRTGAGSAAGISGAGQNRGGGRAEDARGRTAKLKQAGGEAASQLGEAAQDAKRQAREAASSLASQAHDRIRSLADRQVSAGADLVAEVADSVRSAAGSLDDTVPQLAHLAHSAADMVEEFSETMRDQSAAELLEAASDFARRRPSVLFGATAAIGFVMFRLLTAAAPRQSPTYRDADWEDWDDNSDLRNYQRSGTARSAGIGEIGPTGGARSNQGGGGQRYAP